MADTGPETGAESETGPDPLAEVEFLARSANRVAVLAALAERPRTRATLADQLDVSQPTLGRILRDLAERRWVVETDGEYRITGTGRLVADGITDLRDRLATEARLREVADLLPTAAMDVDLRHFGSATVTTPTDTRPNAPLQRMLALLRETTDARLLSYAFNGQKLRLLSDRVEAGEVTVRGVFAREAVEALTEQPELTSRLRTLVESADAELRVTDRSVPVALEVTDRRAHLLLRDDDGVVRASVDTDAAAVREWGVGLHRDYWEAADPLETVPPGA